MAPMTYDTALEGALTALVSGVNRDPFAVLGPHQDDSGHGVVVRAFYPAARSVELRLVTTGELRPRTKRDASGLYEIQIDQERSRAGEFPDYRLRIVFPHDHVVEV